MDRATILPKMDLLIRRATPEDWPHMREVFRAAGQAAWAEILAPEILAILEPPDRWKVAIDSHAEEVWIAVVDGEVCGFTVLRPSQDEDARPETGEIDSFYSHPRHWGIGVGRGLMARALSRIKDLGFASVTLWTEERNFRPRKFYELAGFKLDGTVRERDLRGSIIRELRYRRSLP